jgi:hypothetical protein
VDAGHVDDHAGPFGAKEASHRLTGTEERAPQVNGEDLVEVGGRQLVGVPGDLDAGVVDQDVQPPVLAHHPVVHAGHGLLVGHVRLDQDRPAARLGHLLHAHLHPVLDGFPGGDGAIGAAHVVDRDAGALLAQPDRDRLADAGASPGDQGHLVLQSLHDVLLAGVMT